MRVRSKLFGRFLRCAAVVMFLFCLSAAALQAQTFSLPQQLTDSIGRPRQSDDRQKRVAWEYNGDSWNARPDYLKWITNCIQCARIVARGRLAICEASYQEAL
jgi:hypothetical protein